MTPKPVAAALTTLVGPGDARTARRAGRTGRGRRRGAAAGISRSRSRCLHSHARSPRCRSRSSACTTAPPTRCRSWTNNSSRTWSSGRHWSRTRRSGRSRTRRRREEEVEQADWAEVRTAQDWAQVGRAPLEVSERSWAVVRRARRGRRRGGGGGRRRWRCMVEAGGGRKGEEGARLVGGSGDVCLVD